MAEDLLLLNSHVEKQGTSETKLNIWRDLKFTTDKYKIHLSFMFEATML